VCSEAEHDCLSRLAPLSRENPALPTVVAGRRLANVIFEAPGGAEASLRRPRSAESEKTMSEPSTAWRERVDPDEEARFARQGEALAVVHAAKSARYGAGRLLHRKPVFAARGAFETLADLPEPARHGLFAAPARYAAVVRLSNGAFDVQANTKGDIRGFAVKVQGVAGPSSLGGMTDHQDFLFINHERFATRTSDEFVDVVADSAKGQGALLWGLFRRHGLRGGLARLKTLAATLNKPFSGFASETFNTALPIAVGPYAAKARLEPATPAPAGGKDFAADMRGRLAAGPIVYDVALQFFVDEATTPIEDPTVVWPDSQSPFVTVARLTLTGAADDVEGMAFDPWGGLADHRPLGEIMRARKAAYYLSQKGRRAA
jgi:hypothetical protein